MTAHHRKTVTGGRPLFQNANLIDQVADRVRTPGEVVQQIPLETVQVRENVRKEYQKIHELAESIRTKGLLQPITVTPAEDGGYEIIFGHRRYKALCFLNEREPGAYLKIEAIVKDRSDFDAEEGREIQLVENIQREDLSPLELKEALEYFRAKGLTSADIAAKVGKSEGYVKNVFMTIKALNENIELAKVMKSHAGVTLADIQEVRPLPFREQVQLIREKAQGAIKSREELRERVLALRNTLHSENHATHERRRSYDILTEKDGVLRVRSFRYDPGHITTEEKVRLLASLRDVLARIEATVATGGAA